MAADRIDIEMQDTGEFLALIHTDSGTSELVLMLSDAEDATDGVLANDEATARAVVEFMLKHQVSSDLPERIDITDLDAAYEGAIESIRDLRQ
ncbi:hypothetical protein [Brevibacterium marinum]|uniref:Uncharacterized protein n=1 Tax=Brevibacterium marinum TaxID=418643 RepID=A0A846S513_9MICO|nr:hypothetical protein [Brevibacterium marinum]NJC58720.1 hypothetical protein [Brevibacterium marinum]